MFYNKKLKFQFLKLKEQVGNLLLQNTFSKLCVLKRVRAKEIATVIHVQILCDIQVVKQYKG